MPGNTKDSQLIIKPQRFLHLLQDIWYDKGELVIGLTTHVIWIGLDFLKFWMILMSLPGLVFKNESPY